MAVSHNTAAESHTTNVGSTAEASFTWNMTPTGTPRGILVFVCGYSVSTSDVTSVTYGGVTLSAVSGAVAKDTAAEPAITEAFFLGSSVPTGTQAVVVNRNNNADNMYAVAIAVNAAANTEVYTPGIQLVQEDGDYSEQSVTDGSTGVNSVRYAMGFWGASAAPGVGANSTSLATITPGTKGIGTVRETTAGQGARLVGFTTSIGGAGEDRAGVHLAVREVVAAAGSLLADHRAAQQRAVRRWR